MDDSVAKGVHDSAYPEKEGHLRNNRFVHGETTVHGRGAVAMVNSRIDLFQRETDGYVYLQ